MEKEQHGVDAVSMQMPDAHASSNSISERLRTDTRIARFLSKRLRAVIVCTGPCDLVVCGSKTARIHNGCPELAQITGSGCMMDGLLAAFAAVSKSYFYPAVCAVTEIGLCGENAAAQMRANGTGLGSFHTYFMDAVSLMTGEQLQGGQKIEIPTK